MKPVFIFIIIIAVLAIYFLFFNKGDTTGATYKCVNNTTSKNKFGLLGIPCLVTGMSFDETTSYINNLNDVMKGRNQVVSSADQTVIQNIIGTDGTIKVTDAEQTAIRNVNFANSMPFINGYDSIQKMYNITKNASIAKYTAPANIKDVISGLQKRIYNTNIGLTKLYDYLLKQDTLSDSIASTITTLLSLYILDNNILNFIQTH